MLSSSSIINPSSQVITCKAAVAWGPGEELVMEQVQVSPLQPMEIRIKVVCTSLCRSDLSAWQSKSFTPPNCEKYCLREYNMGWLGKNISEGIYGVASSREKWKKRIEYT